MMRVAVAGAGIAGLTAALALARHGVAVRLLDAAASLGEAGAGVQLSPNATRVLRELGLLDAIMATAVRPERVRIRDARGNDLATLPLGDAEERYGAPFLVAHRADLQAALLAAVRASPGIALSTGAGVDQVAIKADAVDLATDTGERIEADGLVGADGLRSRVRHAIIPNARTQLRFSGRMAWRALVPATAAPPDARASVSNLWLGPGAHLVHYPVRGGALINVVAIVGGHARESEGADPWSAPGEAGEVAHAFARWAPQARALLAAAPDWRGWPLYDHPPLTRWSRGPATLVGDAAHAMLPFLAQGAAQAIEDGWAIGQAGGRYPRFAEAAAAYQRARKPTVDRVQRESARQAAIYHLPWPASSARDAAFRLLGPARMLARYDWLYGPR